MLGHFVTTSAPKIHSRLRLTKKHYLSWFSIGISPGGPGFGEAGDGSRQDANVEHLLDVCGTVVLELENGGSLVTLMNRTTVVSSSEQCYWSCLLTFVFR